MVTLHQINKSIPGECFIIHLPECIIDGILVELLLMRVRINAQLESQFCAGISAVSTSDRPARHFPFIVGMVLHVIVLNIALIVHESYRFHPLLELLNIDIFTLHIKQYIINDLPYFCCMLIVDILCRTVAIFLV